MSKADIVFETLAAIGVGFAIQVPESARRTADIERALIDASVAISKGFGDRIPSPLFSWISVHGERVNVERLRKLMKRYEGKQDDLVWIAAFAFYGLSVGQSRWKILAKAPSGQFSLVNMESARRQIAMRGKASWSVGTGFLIPQGSLTISTKTVLSPAQLARVCD